MKLILFISTLCVVGAMWCWVVTGDYIAHLEDGRRADTDYIQALLDHNHSQREVIEALRDYNYVLRGSIEERSTPEELVEEALSESDCAD